jgi:hypothetical protein
MPKLTVEFSDRVADVLQAAAERNGLSKVDVLRRAITLYEYVDRNVEPGKKALALTDEKTGKVLERVVVT